MRRLARGEGVAPAANLEMGTEPSGDRQRGEVQVGVISSHMAIEGARMAIIVLGVASKHGAKLLGLGIDWLVPLIMGSIAKVVKVGFLENHQKRDSCWARQFGVEAGRAMVALLAA